MSTVFNFTINHYVYQVEGTQAVTLLAEYCQRKMDTEAMVYEKFYSF